MNKRTVIITGASRGIGRATAMRFAQEGYNVLINYLHSEQEAMRLLEMLKKSNCNAHAFKADVSKHGKVDDMVSFCVEVFGALDVIVNNAGVAQTRLFTDITQDDWRTVTDINLGGVFNCCQCAAKHMIKNKKGRIINISSVWGMVGASCEVHYSAAKAGVIGLTKALAKELAPSGIRVNCIAPGIIETDMLKDYTEAELGELKKEIPSGRLGTPFDVAECALYLADEKNDYITGQVISPNGGFVV